MLLSRWRNNERQRYNFKLSSTGHDVCVEQTIVYLMITRVKISAPTNDVSKVNKVKIYEQRWIYVGVEGALTRQAKGEMWKGRWHGATI